MNKVNGREKSQSPRNMRILQSTWLSCQKKTEKRKSKSFYAKWWQHSYSVFSIPSYS